MTILADLVPQRTPVLLGGLAVNLVAAQARRVGPFQNHLAYIAVHMAVAGVQILVIRQREVDLIILKQVVTGDELVRIGQSGAFRFASAQMALGADRCHYLGIIATLL